MRRSLIHYWRANLAVALGAAVATAVLAGALVVGDSVRGSLRDLTLERLGGIDHALAAERPFGEELAARIGAGLEEGGETVRLAPALALRGSAVHGESRTRASGVAILGVDERFGEFWEPPPDLSFDAEGAVFPPAVINRALAEELGAESGDEILLSFQRPAEIPRETLVGRQDAAETIESFRVSVAGVLADHGAGGFSLASQQSRPLNVFVRLERLQRALFGRRDAQRVNLLLVGGRGESAAELERPEEILGAAVEPSDLGLTIGRGAGHLPVMSHEFVLSPALSEAVLEAASELGAPVQPVLTYLANSIRIGEREIPYSTLSALDPPAAPALGPFRLASGEAVPPLGDDEILLNRWAADDLGAQPGDEVEIDYYELGPRDELTTRTRSFKLRGVVPIEGLAADPNLTPEFPGMHDAEDIAAWDPPFPVELDRIRERDERYWDDYRATPKAFVALEIGRKLWRSRFGDLTSIRLAPPPWMELAELESELHRALAAHLQPGRFGLSFRAVKEEGLRAARGATDFAQLFLGLSMFLIASAALLVGLLFRLGVERRAREVGLLRAVGYRAQAVRRQLLGEGALLAAAGGLLGLGGALGYAWLMLAGLRTWWLPAVGTPVLFLHVEAASLGIGWAASVAVVLFAIWWSLRKLGRVPTPALLAGSAETETGPVRSRRALPLALISGLLAAGLAAAAWLGDAASSPGLAFGIGACLLVAGLALFARWCGGAGERPANALGSLVALGMGARNSARNRGRSLLSVALVASACFIIVVVAANRAGSELEVTDRSSGTGGFTLVAESDAPIYQDLGSAELPILPFRLLPGEDVSCLNLYRPQRPRILGVPPEMVERGGFAFQKTIREVDEPWSLLEEELEPGVVPAFGDANSVLWILHLGLGEDLVVQAESGAEVRLRLVGLLSRSIFQSEILISEESFTRLFPSRTGYSFFLADPPPERVREVGAALEAELERFGFDAGGTGERLASFLAVENTYLATFQTLGGLGLILGTLGLGVVLLRNVLERRAELAALRAFGYRRAILSRMVLAENLTLLAAGMLIGSLAGLAAAAPHLASAGARLPWVPLLLTLAVIFLAGMLSSLLAVAGSLRVPLIPALRAE